MDEAGVAIEQVTGLAGAVERGRHCRRCGRRAAGGRDRAAQALVIDAGSFGVSALLITLTTPRGQAATTHEPEDASYLTRLREGWQFLGHDQVLVAITWMVVVTNLLDQAYVVVFVPVWAKESGGGAAAVGQLFATFSGAAVIGSVVAATIAERLPRHTTYLVAFLLVGAPGSSCSRWTCRWPPCWSAGSARSTPRCAGR